MKEGLKLSIYEYKATISEFDGLVETHMWFIKHNSTGNFKFKGTGIAGVVDVITPIIVPNNWAQKNFTLKLMPGFKVVLIRKPGQWELCAHDWPSTVKALKLDIKYLPQLRNVMLLEDPNKAGMLDLRLRGEMSSKAYYEGHKSLLSLTENIIWTAKLSNHERQLVFRNQRYKVSAYDEVEDVLARIRATLPYIV